MSKSQSPEKVSSQIDSKEMREIRKKIRTLCEDVIPNVRTKLDQCNPKQQKKILKTICRQLPWISWEAVKNKPLEQIKTIIENKIGVWSQKDRWTWNVSSDTPTDNNDGSNTDVPNKLKGIGSQELPSSITSITETKTQEITNVLNEFSLEEQQKLTLLDLKVNCRETFETSIRTLDQVRDFLKWWLVDYQKTIAPTNYKAFIDHIIVPTLKLVAMQSDEIKNDSTVQNYVNQIKKIALQYMKDEPVQPVQPVTNSNQTMIA